MKAKIPPSFVFIFGNAGLALPDGLYLSAYAVFLFEFLSNGAGGHSDVQSIKRAMGIIIVVMIFKPFVEMIVDVASSSLADLKPYFSRRGMFVLGAGLHVITFTLLAAFPLWIVTFKSAITALVLAELFRAIANSCITGTLDGWAISLERQSNPRFHISNMFATARVCERTALVAGALLALAVLITQSWLRSHSITPIATSNTEVAIYASWALLWTIASVLSVFAFGFLWYFSRGFIAAEGYEVDGPRPSLADVVKQAFDPRILLGLLVLACMYTLSYLLNFFWPAIRHAAIPHPTYDWLVYLFPLGSMVASLCGALASDWAVKRMGDGSTIGTAARGSLIAALMVGIAGILTIIVATASVGNGVIPLLGQIGFVLLLLSRVPYFFAKPFVDTAIHQYVADEEVRSAVVSIRSSSSNFLVAVSVFFIASVAHVSGPLDQGNIGRAVAIVLISISALIAAAMLYIQRRARVGAGFDASLAPSS